VELGSYNNDEAFEALALRLAPGMTSALFGRLLSKFGSISALQKATSAALGQIRGMTSARIAAIRTNAGRSAAQRDAAMLNHLNARVIPWSSNEYPDGLRQLNDPPGLLWVRGQIPAKDQVAVAIVGTRECTDYGRRMAYQLSMELAMAGIVIVSGLARGIDGVAHQAAIDAGGLTVAICGCGLAQRYPAANADLLELIPAHGAVISEWPCDVPPRPGNFPPRNRIIAALAKGVVIVEAKPGSGALITADLALDMGKDVFAVPGPADVPTSEGPNSLLRAGAPMASSARDILEELGMPHHAAVSRIRSNPQVIQLDDRLNKIFSLLRSQPVPFADLLDQSGFAVGDLHAALLELELKNLARQLPGRLYVRI